MFVKLKFIFKNNELRRNVTKIPTIVLRFEFNLIWVLNHIIYLTFAIHNCIYYNNCRTELRIIVFLMFSIIFPHHLKHLPVCLCSSLYPKTLISREDYHLFLFYFIIIVTVFILLESTYIMLKKYKFFKSGVGAINSSATHGSHAPNLTQLPNLL